MKHLFTFKPSDDPQTEDDTWTLNTNNRFGVQVTHGLNGVDYTPYQVTGAGLGLEVTHYPPHRNLSSALNHAFEKSQK